MLLEAYLLTREYKFKEVDTKTDDVDIVIKDKMDKDDDVIVVNTKNESISIDPFFLI